MVLIEQKSFNLHIFTSQYWDDVEIIFNDAKHERHLYQAIFSSCSSDSKSSNLPKRFHFLNTYNLTARDHVKSSHTIKSLADTDLVQD